jgi:hypothetical protein
MRETSERRYIAPDSSGLISRLIFRELSLTVALGLLHSLLPIAPQSEASASTQSNNWVKDVSNPSGTEPKKLGEVRFEGQGFFRQKSDRAGGATSVFLNPDWTTEGTYFSARLNAQAVTLLTDRSSFTVESADAYVSTSRQWIDDHQFTLGRRRYDWSVMDDRWKLGLWSPRFNWDPVRPQQIGLTGLFYSYENRNWRVLAYASPISVPERGFPLRIEDGNLESSSPDWVSPFSQVNLMNQAVDIRYSLQYPSMSDLLFMPGAALSVRHGDPSRTGVWAQAMIASLPVNQVDIALQAELMASTLTLNSTLHPRRLRHDIASLEFGWNGEIIKPWISVTGERPEGAAVPEGWITSPVGPTLISAGGVEFALPTGNNLGVQLISARQSLPESNGAALSGASPPRFQWQDAVRFSAGWDGPSRYDYDFVWNYDITNQSSLITADFGLQAMRRLHLGVGADFFTSPTRQGFLGQFYGNDRVRARVTYAF